MSLSTRVLQSIQNAGLEQYASRFSVLSDSDFMGLLMSDYATYGVVDVEDKQRLFRCRDPAEPVPTGSPDALVHGT